MSFVAPSNGLTLADVAAPMPQPATSAPPAVALNSGKGAALRYALEDHTHQSRLQARRIQVTPVTTPVWINIMSRATS